ncbi:MAG: hypothetical protein F4187_05260, partial [Gemmatimonadetes bacterium]|nr:hypothetical protein [Gemmatimonadota bacterium]
MSDLNARIREWRQLQERETSLSPRELDELEDHLGAHADLEMELNAVLAPDQAFAIARRELGETASLSKEFAKAGQPRWWRLVVAGCAMFVVSFTLPAVGEHTTSHGFFTMEHGAVSGWGAFWDALIWGDGLGPWSALTNLAMLAGIVTLAIRRQPPRRRWMPVLLAAAGIMNLVYWPIWTVTEGHSPMNLL